MESGQRPPMGLPLPSPLGGSPEDAQPLPDSVGPREAYARLRRHCVGILEDWKGFGLEERFAFAEKRKTPLRRIEAALILISNLPEEAGPADFGPLAASLESGELSFLSHDSDSGGCILSKYAERMKRPS